MNQRLAVLLTLLSFLGCATTPVVRFTRIEPARVQIKGVRRIAVMDFASDGSVKLGTSASDHLVTALVAQNRFQLLERSDINKVLREISLDQSGVLVDSTVKQVGKLAGADAVVVGEVKTSVSDVKGKEKIEKKVGTGTYEEYEGLEHVTWGKRVKKKREIMKTVLVDQDYLARSGGVTLSLRLVETETGQVLASFSDQRAFSKKAKGPEEIAKLPTSATTLEGLVQDLVERFVWQISPHNVWESRYLVRGEKGDPLVPRGIAYAQEGLWDDAMGQWKEAVDQNPGYAAAYNNLGVAYEESFKLTQADDSYHRALNLAPDNKDIMENLQRLRKWHHTK